MIVLCLLSPNELIKCVSRLILDVACFFFNFFLKCTLTFGCLQWMISLVKMNLNHYPTFIWIRSSVD